MYLSILDRDETDYGKERNCILNKNIGFRIILKVKFEQKNKTLTQHT